MTKRFQFCNNRIISAVSTAQGVTFKDGPTEIIITGNIVDVPGVIGLEVQSATSGKTVVSNNIVTNPEIGISFSSTEHFTATGNFTIACTTYGIEAAQGAKNGTIVGNTMANCFIGAVASGASCINVLIGSNTITNATSMGVQVQLGTQLNVKGNTILNCAGDYGIYADTVSRSTISGNHVSCTVAPTGNGNAIFMSGNDNTVSANDVDYTALGSPKGYGITFNTCARARIQNNNIHGKHYKSMYSSGGSDIVIDGNTTSGATEDSLNLTSSGLVVMPTHTTMGDSSNIAYAGGGTFRQGIVFRSYDYTLRWNSVLDLYNQTVTTSAPSAGGAGALPATPLGYIQVKIEGSVRRIPFYA